MKDEKTTWSGEKKRSPPASPSRPSGAEASLFTASLIAPSPSKQFKSRPEPAYSKPRSRGRGGSFRKCWQESVQSAGGRGKFQFGAGWRSSVCGAAEVSVAGLWGIVSRNCVR